MNDFEEQLEKLWATFAQTNSASAKVVNYFLKINCQARRCLELTGTLATEDGAKAILPWQFLMATTVDELMDA